MGNLNEHLWSGIIHRSETGETRKEDDIDILDLEGLNDYIQDHYKPCHGSYVGGTHTATLDGKKCLQIKVGFNPSGYSLSQTITFHNYSQYCRIYADGADILNGYLQGRGYDTSKGRLMIDCKNIKTNKEFLKLLDDFIEWCSTNPEYAPTYMQKKKGEK